MIRALSCLVVLGLLPVASAQNDLGIEWGRSAATEALNFSKGMALEPDDLVPELVPMGAGFRPPGNNGHLWALNWLTIDALGAGEPTGGLDYWTDTIKPGALFERRAKPGVSQAQESPKADRTTIGGGGITMGSEEFLPRIVVPEPLPEPGVLMLAASGGLLLLRRRRE